MTLFLMGVLGGRPAPSQVSGLTGARPSSHPEAGEEAARQAIWAPSAAPASALGPDVASGAPRQNLRLSPEALLRVLDGAPMEQDRGPESLDGVSLSLPMPDGAFARFVIEESPVLAPDLAARHPEIRTFRGRGIDDPRASVRLDWTPLGFHAIVFSPKGTVYIDPASPGDRFRSVSYFRRDAGRKAAPAPRCTAPAERSAAPSLQPFGALFRSVAVAAEEATLRTYRLAVAATGEYTAFFGGSVPNALAAITTTINRVDGIYERELAVRFVLVGEEEEVIYTDPATDPYSNGNAITMEAENQTTLDAQIDMGYDVGHVFGTSGGGFASAGVCVTGQKGKGVSAISSPSADPFDVDFVAHEIGHQFGAIHTFNGTTGICSGGRDAGSAYEPGSGSTILAYAGICGAENLQSLSDDYFHWKSLEEINTFLASTASCAAEAPSGNSTPVVLAGADYTIPSETPFEIAGNAIDADGDPLTYTWEEADLGAASPPNTDDGDRPIFRSFPPTGNRSRTLPRLSDLLSGVSVLGESLPTTTRALSFRLTARDNRSNGGATSSDGMQIQVRGDSGPFAVTQPNGAVSWPAGSTQTVLWNVANTAAAPVSAARVRIRLSVNGGASFPYVLAQNTPNDGSQSVTLPTVATGTARIKVEAFGNVFFDVSDSDFSVTAGSVLVSSVTPSSGPPAGGTSVTISGSGFVSGATVTFGGAPATAVQFVGSTQLTATVPPRAAGTLQDVAVRNPSAVTGTLPKGWLADFLDVPAGAPFHDFIARIFRFGITAGCGGSNFCPVTSVTRAQMAVFLLTAKYGPGYVPPPATGTVFSDVPAGGFAAAFIERLAAEGITAGCGGGQYCPITPVTREQMAVFLLLGAHGSGFSPPTGIGLFPDVPTSSGFAPWVEQLFAEGVTSGCSGGNYCPGSPITRGQMAVFLVATFELP